MNSFYFLVELVVLMFFVAYVCTLIEMRDWNGGICRKCGGKWRHVYDGRRYRYFECSQCDFELPLRFFDPERIYKRLIKGELRESYLSWGHFFYGDGMAGMSIRNYGFSVYEKCKHGLGWTCLRVWRIELVRFYLQVEFGKKKETIVNCQ